MNGPLFGGDTLYAESEVLDVDAAGVIRTLIRGHKADGAEVARITCRMEVDRRDAGDDPAREERFAAYHVADDGVAGRAGWPVVRGLRRGRKFRARAAADLPS